MHLTHLSLTNFRNYRRLELDLAPGTSIFWGDNAQGKTNLLEAVYLLATTRSDRAGSDAEFVRWGAAEDGVGAARVVGRAVRGRAEVQVELALMLREGVSGPSQRTARRLRVNGLPRRATEVIGQVLAVLFTTQDIDLLTGPPSGRRRYLDLMLSQVDHSYLRALQRFQRVMQQRNVLLRRIAEDGVRPDQLGTWDEELVLQGALITERRSRAVAELHEQASVVHNQLSGGQGTLAIRYTPQLAEERKGGLPETIEDLRSLYRDALARRRQKEIQAGVSLVGPHRDDMTLEIDGHAAGSFGSRAQQRTVALALRLAEAEFLRGHSGESPVLLLDDILSELDRRRRVTVLSAVERAGQALLTTAELDRFSPAFLDAAQVFQVAAGSVSRMNAEAVARERD